MTNAMVKHPINRATRRIRAAAIFAIVTALLTPAAPAAESELKVVFLPGGREDNEFWMSMTRFAEAVADDLNIDLQVTYPGRLSIAIDGMKLVKSLDKDTYFITVYIEELTRELLRIAEGRQARSFLINTDVLKTDKEEVGMPREKFQRWIGHMQPDDVQAGYRVADVLLDHFDQAETVRMIAVNADDEVQVDADRRAGLRQRLSESPDARLLAMAQGEWEEDAAHSATKKLLKTHPQANAVWAVNDPMALGAVTAFKKAGKQPGGDFVAAGIDWTSRSLAAVRSGEMLATVGGHFMEAGIALLLIYDYHHGHDFDNDPGVRFKTSMYAIGQNDIETYYDKVGADPDWSSIDFKQFTKTHNPDLERYDFSWPTISEQL